MKLINIQAIYVMWLREMKRFLRAKSRIIGMLAMPLFFLVFLGAGFSQTRFPGMPESFEYMDFLAPGIIGMTMIFTSTLAGVSLLWDKEFGFLKEVMVTPASRLSIVIGRTLGGITTSLIQGILILIISGLLGVKIISITGFLLAIVFMILISCTFVGLGLAIASVMKDMHGFQLIVQFIIFPFFFLSGALYPLDNMPVWLKYLSYADPLTYGVDGLRGSMIGVSEFSAIFNIAILLVTCVVMISIGAILFQKSEV